MVLCRDYLTDEQIDEFFQVRAALKCTRAFKYMVEEFPRQGRLEGCHRMSAATHLICGLESV